MADVALLVGTLSNAEGLWSRYMPGLCQFLVGDQKGGNQFMSLHIGVCISLSKKINKDISWGEDFLKRESQGI